jgi:hypothetical protein
LPILNLFSRVAKDAVIPVIVKVGVIAFRVTCTIIDIRWDALLDAVGWIDSVKYDFLVRIAHKTVSSIV